MKDPNSWFKRAIRWTISRWVKEEHPGAEPYFRIWLLLKDVGIFLGLPIASVFAYISLGGGGSQPKKHPPSNQRRPDNIRLDASKSQIISFQGGGGSGSPYTGMKKRAPGSLVKLRLLNVVETFSTAPVHAQIIDAGLGKNLIGGTLIGDANPDPNFERINMSFRFARDPAREDLATPISARALSLDGTLGVDAEKKKGFFTRSSFGASGTASQALGNTNGSVDLKDILFRALSSGFLQEFGAAAQVEKNKAQVLTLQPDTEFFAELTDYFPGGAAK